jgi:hypothetical protein
LIYPVASENRVNWDCGRKTARLRSRPLQKQKPPEKSRGVKPRLQNPLLTFATVGCQVFLQAGDGHCHIVCQAAFLESGQSAQANQVAHSIAGCEVLVFEPSMLWTRDSVGREGAHEAPVENVEEQNSREANKRQTLFSPIVRYCKDAG